MRLHATPRSSRNLTLFLYLVLFTSLPMSQHVAMASLGRRFSVDVSRATMQHSIKSLGDAASLANEKRCSTKDIRKEADLQSLVGCTVIEGNLLLAIMPLRREDWYFPKLKEVTGYVLIYFVSSQRVLNMFPNLVVVRGQNFIYNYAFIVKDCQMEYLGFYSLRLIQRGGVRIEGNPQLCHVDSIDWNQLTVLQYRSASGASDEPWLRWQKAGLSSKESMNFFINNRRLCPVPCPINCPKMTIDGIRRELCWSHKACQSICQVRCPDGAPCHMLDTNKCCHKECLAGCYGDGPNMCVTCKNVLFNGTCIEKCPPNFYKFMQRRCVTKKECFKHTSNDPNNYSKTTSYSLYNGSCVPVCPPQYQRNSSTGKCVPCNPSCPKRCSVALIYSIRDSERISGCESIRDLHISIRDGGQGAHVMEELKKNFEHLRVIEENLRIVRSMSLQSLSFLSNLREIRGQVRNSQPYGSEEKVISFEVIGNERLESLWEMPPGEKLIIRRGRISINMNRQLCADKVLKFLDNHVVFLSRNLTKGERHFIDKANGDLMPCNVTMLNISVTGIRSRQTGITWPRVNDNERKLVTMLVMIKPTTKSISLSFDRASCDGNSWKALEAVCNYHSGSENFCSFIIQHLQPATRYALYMEAKTVQGGSGAISDIVYLTTKPETPSHPLGLRFLALTSSSLKIMWKPPKYPHGVITRYLLWYRRMGIRYQDFLRRNYCSHKYNLQSNRQINFYTPEIELPSEKQTIFNESCTSCAACVSVCSKTAPLDKPKSVSFEDSLMKMIFKKQAGSIIPTSDYISPSVRASTLNLLTPTGDVFPNDSEYKAAWERMKPKPRNGKENGDGAPFELFSGSPESSTTTPTPAPGPTSAAQSDFYNWEGSISLNASTLQKKNEGELSYLLTGLHHFSEYVIEIQACQEAPDIHNPSDHPVCSSKTRGLHRTLAGPAADNIDDSQIEISNPQYTKFESADVTIRWPRPLNPNGPILYYYIRYRQKLDREESWIMPCIPAQQWAELHSGSSEINDPSQLRRIRRSVTPNADDDGGLSKIGGVTLKLPPGTHEFQIKAFSLAGNGNWTRVRAFNINNNQRVDHTIIIAVMCAAVAVAVTLLVVIKCICYHRKQREKVIYWNPDYWVYTPDEWELQSNQIEIESPLGQGSFGMVHKGIIRNLDTPAKPYLEEGDTSGPIPRVEAAIKTVQKGASYDDKRAFLKEVCQMKNVNSYHIVRLLGVVSNHHSTSDLDPKVAMEFMYHADLARYLREAQVTNRPSSDTILAWAAQIADGMAYLCEKKILHRDLAARNCMVAKSLTAKIGDFGLAREIGYHNYYRKRGQAKLPVRWMSPEALSRGYYSVYSEVWSYGVLLWEMLTFAALPYCNLNQEAIIDRVMKGHTLLAEGRGAMENILECWRDEPCPAILVNLMRDCFVYAYAERPSFMNILDRLNPHIPRSVLEHSFYNCGLTKEDFVHDVEHLAPASQLLKSAQDESSNDSGVGMIRSTVNSCDNRKALVLQVHVQSSSDDGLDEAKPMLADESSLADVDPNRNNLTDVSGSGDRRKDPVV